MKTFFRRHLLPIFGVLMVCFASCNNHTTKQIKVPPIDTIKVWVGDTTVCYARCKHLIISNGKNNKVLDTINRQNYELVFEQYADSEKIDVEGALKRMFHNNFEEDLYRPKKVLQDLIQK